MKKKQFGLFRRGKVYYGQDDEGKQWSLGVRDKKQAEAIIDGMNGAIRNPDLELAKALAVIDTLEPERRNRTWQAAIDIFMKSGEKESSKQRKKRALDRPV